MDKLEKIKNTLFNYKELQKNIEEIITLYKGACACVTNVWVNCDNTIGAEYEIYINGESWYDEVSFPYEWIGASKDALIFLIKKEKRRKLNEYIRLREERKIK